MACCGKSKGRVVKSAPSSNLLIADAKDWLPFQRTTAPPGGWGVEGFTARSPEEAADKLAGLRMQQKRFISIQHVYKELVGFYKARPGSPIAKLGT